MTLLAALAVALGLLSTTVTLVMVVAAAPNSRPAQAARLRRVLWGALAVGAAAAVGGIAAILAERPGLGAVLGASPALGTMLLLAFAFRTPR